MRSVITYFTGGLKYPIPSELGLSYLLVQIRFLAYGYVISSYFNTDFTALTAILCILIADFRFFIDFIDYIEAILDSSEEDDEE